MINRRLLRVKVVQVLYSYYNNEDSTIKNANQELEFSINKTYDLYHYFLLIPIEMTRLALARLEKKADKKLPSFEDLNPNRKFVDNLFVSQLNQNSSLESFLASNKISWANHEDLMRNLFTTIIESELYTEYMAEESISYEEDKRFWINIFKKQIAECEDLGTSLEDLSIFWNDDAELVLSMIQKTIKKFDQKLGTQQPLLPQFHDDDDYEFAIKLLHQSVLLSEENQSLIEKSIKNWDMERLALLDKIILQVAITEMRIFDNIPIKVSLNEYIDIAKNYSTQRSGVFINGVLDDLSNKLMADGRIKKSGRGLMV